MAAKSFTLLSALVLLLGACSTQQPVQEPPDKVIGDYKLGKPYQVAGIWYYPKVDYNYSETGIASWYGPGFNGKKTANGETYDQNELTAAHRTLPMPSLLRVTNLENGRSVVVRVNDRGPFKNGRIIDLSLRAAELLKMTEKGTAKVRVTIQPHESRQLAAIAQNREAAANAPLAAPVVEVAEVQLEQPVSSSYNGVAVLETGVPALSAPFGSAAAAIAGTTADGETQSAPESSPNGEQSRLSWLIEGEDGEVVAVPRIAALSPHAGAASGTAASNVLAAESKPAAGSQAPMEGAGTIVEVRKVAAFLPDGKVAVEPVRDSDIFIQAGSFLRRDNATRLSARLRVFAKSNVTIAEVGRRVFFRVRLGPVDTVDEADRLLNILLANGMSDARVVVD